MEFKGKKILVIGAGMSGIAACTLLYRIAQVTLHDSNVKLNEEELRKKLPDDFSGRIHIGRLTDEETENAQITVLSPGVPLDSEEVLQLKAKGSIITGEIELAYELSKGRLIAITGTNGKTTTTSLVGEIMKAYTDEVFVVGNIGIPYTKMAEKTTNNSITVAEISSFQLETIDRFKPDVSAILNITPDHLNRHHSMENYCRIKASITKNQTENDTCVLNYEDAWLKEFGKKAKCNVIWFSSARKLERGFYLDSDLIIYNDGNKENVICNVNELNIIGKHNYENAMAAAACAVAMNVPIEIIHKAMINFVAVEHRIEYVCTKHGVKYYNDSKGTNPDASIQAVRAMQTKTYLIGGGYDKGNEYDDWIKSFDGKIKKLILMGQTAEKIAETAKKLGFNDIVFVKSMQEAVDYCSKNASEGETVLLSPCCASWDMFKNYEERGHIFKDLARAIKE